MFYSIFGREALKTFVIAKEVKQSLQYVLVHRLVFNNNFVNI
jgi:hypothetical protein